VRVVARILCGSHLYGTNIRSSDREYKIVYIPEGKRILLQQADKLDPEALPPIVDKLKKDARLRANPDVEFVSLCQYLKLLCQGQTNALGMFFAPSKFHVSEPSPEWYTIQKHTPRWISKESATLSEGLVVEHPMDIKAWKRVYHALRVAEEALEILQTGKLTFPRPEKHILTAILMGKVPFETAIKILVSVRAKGRQAAEESTLPEHPDWKYADILVETFYRSAVACGSGSSE
jgi:uncharacterized protein